MFKRKKRYRHEDLQDAWIASSSFEQIRTQDLIRTLLVDTVQNPDDHTATGVLHALADHIDTYGIVPMNEAGSYLAAITQLEDEEISTLLEQDTP